MRRLTHVEYNNAVADLLGDKSQPANGFPDDSQVGLFKNTATVQSVPPLLAEGYLNSAAQLAERVNVKELVGCDLAAAGCVADFIQRFGRRAYRRPLKPDEGQRLQQVYENVRTKADVETGVRAVVAAVLVAPQFLYYFEAGGQDSGDAGRQEARAVRSGGSARLLAVGVVAGQRIAGCRCCWPALHARAGAGAGPADVEGSPRARRDQRLL